MDRLISLNAVLSAIGEWIAHREYDYTNATEYLRNRIKAIPSAEPKIGHWIEGKYRDDDIRYNDSSYKCDKCGRIVDFKENFCPNCGAKMIEPQEISDRNLKMWEDIYEEEKRRERSDKE